MKAILLAILLMGSVSHADQSCESEVGAAAAKTMVEACMQVSPATHPPCNASNSCGLIVSEIRRGCDYITDKDNATKALCEKYQGPMTTYAADALELATLMLRPEVQSCLNSFSQGKKIEMGSATKEQLAPGKNKFQIHVWLNGGDVVLGESDFSVEKQTIGEGESRITCQQLKK